jgi:hypothetical protein
MTVSDPGKLAIILIIVAGLFALVLVGKAETTVILPIITAIVGVVIGNGKAAVSHHAPSPIIMSNVQPDEVVTIHGSYPIERENHVGEIVH